jgi:cytoskeleton protein RodZ
MANLCSDELRKARETQNISLEDLTASTRISVQFLKAIEEGNFSVLPQTYIRAFIRDYAREVGLNPDDIIRKFEQVQKPQQESIADKKVSLNVQPVVKARLPRRKGATQTAVLITITVILILALAISVWFFNREKKSEVREIPFQNAIEEQEAKSTENVDTSKFIGPQLPPENNPELNIHSDSLTLTATATESAWISVIMDDKLKKEILLLPNKSAQWKAAMQFKITIGNAGSTIFKLNDKVVGAIGKRGGVIKDYILTRKFLENKP